jgi:hypothetical protein
MFINISSIALPLASDVIPIDVDKDSAKETEEKEKAEKEKELEEEKELEKERNRAQAISQMIKEECVLSLLYFSLPLYSLTQAPCVGPFSSMRNLRLWRRSSKTRTANTNSSAS